MSFESVLTEIAALRNDVKSLTKIVRKIKAKQDDPDGTKAASRAKNNGFNREQAISPKLADFLGVEADKLVSRSFVTRAINKYVTEKGLKHPENGRVLVLDDKLRTLLDPPADTQITFLNLQKYLSPHYTKVEQTA
jgi:upstream activation factor subunit UAF30|tara:strand:+ start:223 stop:630 length:408 start_codon:yes stop_codon:yes gene_type:complete